MITIDASIALALVLENGPPGIADAVEISDGVVPANFYVEMAQVLLRTERRLSVSPEYLMRAIGVVHALPVRVHTPRLESIIAIGRKHGLSAYDAAYLAVAIDTDSQLATLDTRLAAAAKAEKRLWKAANARPDSGVSFLATR